MPTPIRCDCESVHCSHEPGDCHSTVTCKVDWYGHRTNLCRVCLNDAIHRLARRMDGSDAPQIVQLAPLMRD